MDLTRQIAELEVKGMNPWAWWAGYRLRSNFLHGPGARVVCYICALEITGRRPANYWHNPLKGKSV